MSAIFVAAGPGLRSPKAIVIEQSSPKLPKPPSDNGCAAVQLKPVTCDSRTLLMCYPS
jgi:hypothetical protein